MSVTYTAMVPIAVSPAGGTGAINPVNMTPTSHCAEGDIVVLSGSGIAPAAANVANGIVGIAQHDSSLNYGGQSPTSTFNPNLLLGISNVGTLMPASPGQTIVAKLGAPTLVELNRRILEPPLVSRSTAQPASMWRTRPLQTSLLPSLIKSMDRSRFRVVM